MINHANQLFKNQMYSMSYLDNVITHSSDMEHHISHIESILKTHSTYGLKLYLKKCQFYQTSVQYLGHEVSEQGTSMLSSCIEKFLIVSCLKQARNFISFLGFVNYYSAFIPEYGILTAEMNGLRIKRGAIELTLNIIRDFQAIKEVFLKSPTRAYPDYSPNVNPFILDTDFSAKCCGAVLSQVQERFIACAAFKNITTPLKQVTHRIRVSY